MSTPAPPSTVEKYGRRSYASPEFLWTYPDRPGQKLVQAARRDGWVPVARPLVRLGPVNEGDDDYDEATRGMYRVLASVRVVRR